MAKNRVKRIESLIREEAARFITSELADPRLGFVTVTRVECTRDLSQACIYVSVLGDEAQKRTTMRGIEDAGGAIRTAVGRALDIRRVPEVRFVLDTSVDKSIRMSELIRQARAGDPDGGQTSEPSASDPEPEEPS